MTEADWLGSDDPLELISWLNERLSARKRRLFAVGCCRRIWHLLTDLRSRGAVDVAERHADGAATDAELAAAHEAAALAAVAAADSNSVEAAQTAADYGQAAARNRHDSRAAEAAAAVEAREQAELLRHIAGNPFRPSEADPAWLRWNGGAIANLAYTIYEARLSKEMFLLADALEDAGCSDPEILNHCRQGGRHPRGCWVLDLLLGKS